MIFSADSFFYKFSEQTYYEFGGQTYYEIGDQDIWRLDDGKNFPYGHVYGTPGTYVFWMDKTVHCAICHKTSMWTVEFYLRLWICLNGCG